ncbi:hypothetical protein E1B28_006599 [Marasmius oreades]|uniref:RRM domain-containing protein n=1 Tax=Marasmius oreades TaxID=181124 RepID=A0A9P7UWH4_9AGAR|nr:uncharacterized protein E1B28_006599 [Marasmius oreades]KAG7095915.1 hypothetical protein E1B28_006599 [Marasmius oreades]
MLKVLQEQLIDVFKSVGQVIGFRLVFDRDTGKPKGYGFCEFADHETASSAVRNLNGYEVGGRPLRIDLADSDPFLEGKTTVRGELVDGGSGSTQDRWRSGDNVREPNDFLNSLPSGIPVPPGATSLDMISTTLATMNQRELMDVLAHMKAFVITHPDQAHALLVAHPQLAYALFQALLLNKIVDSGILHRMLSATTQAAATGAQPTGAAGPSRPSGAPQSNNGTSVPPPQSQFQPTYGYAAPPPPGMMPPYMTPGMPPPGAMFPPPMPPSYFRPPPPMGLMSSPPPQSSSQTSDKMSAPPGGAPLMTHLSQAQPPEITDSQKAMLMQVFSLKPEEINRLPEQEKAAIQQLRAQFMNNMNPLATT